MSLRTCGLFLLALIGFALPAAFGEESQRPSKLEILRASFLESPPNIPTPTLGGTQFWGDQLYAGQWRIQENVVTGHYRLLAPNDVRQAWGNRSTCDRRLAELRREGQVAPLRGKLVVVLHGLMGSRLMMKPLANYVAENGYEVINVTYPSTRASVADHAQALGAILAHTDEVTEINFVAHSLGNLIVRRYLYDYAAAHEGQIDPRIRRFVMIGPPNHGARCAVMLGGNVLFDATLGESAQQLGRRWDELAPTLAVPSCEFGIIAGGLGNSIGLNPTLPDDDDGTVRVAEARLAGADDFVLVPTHHGLLPLTPSVHRRTVLFFQTGCFDENGERHPIDEDEPTEVAQDSGASRKK